MIPRALAAGVLAATLAAASGQAVEIDPAPYRAAAASGAVGAVTGHIYEERKKPQAADQPLAGTAVIAVPKSADVLRKLEEIKQTSRNSMESYRTAGPSIVAIRRAYEKALWESGAVDLVKTATVDADGHFALSDLPAGDWLLIATHTVKIDKHIEPSKNANSSSRPSAGPNTSATANEGANAGANANANANPTSGTQKKRNVYAPGTRLTGYQRMTVWVREVTVANGRSENLELSDRGAWFSGVVEETAPDAGR
jgi:hypothetical protein